ncbi:unnamed protein product [Prorocentrum cordatum]|uniref:EF-hand domain-containing protein n=1 Tax=Prorocentrum cordatum TaxID=2364126 RepID=A0ABN9QKF4_9DINO|nr:unnamed protein product [Polarella glacialis]
MDLKLDWLVSHARASGTAGSAGDAGCSSRAFGSWGSAPVYRGAADLRGAAGGGARINVMPPPETGAPAAAGPEPVAGLLRCLSAQEPLDQGCLSNRSSSRSQPPRLSGQHRRSSVRVNAEAAGSFIPNLSKRHATIRTASGSGSPTGGSRGSAGFPRPGSDMSRQVPAVLKGNFFARKLRERSESTDTEDVMKRIQSLPSVLRVSRNKTVDYIYTVLDDPSSSTLAWWTSKCLQGLVLLSVLVTFLQIVEDPPLHGWPAAIVETVFDVVFLIEFAVRLCCAPSKASVVFISHTWIDIIAASAIVVRAAVGFVLPQSQDDPVSIIFLGVVPTIRLLKVVRHFETFNVLIAAVYITMEALPMLLYAVALITMIFATLIYVVEPELFSSPFRAVWFCLVTVTTVGYGDIAPETTAGISIVMTLIVLGVIMMAVPIGIIGNTFNQVWNARDYSLLLSKTRMKLHKWGYTAHDIPTLFRLVDSNGNGVLEVGEFCELVKEMKIGLPEDRIAALFEHMDKDGSGGLDAAEFAMAVFPDTFLEAFVTHTNGRRSTKAEPCSPSVRQSRQSRKEPLSPALDRPSTAFVGH